MKITDSFLYGIYVGFACFVLILAGIDIGKTLGIKTKEPITVYAVDHDRGIG